jgi:copper(I)-binding protein
MAKIKTISYGRTFNNGNYESTRIEISADVDPNGEVHDNVMKQLMREMDRLRELDIKVRNSQHTERSLR